MATQGFEPSLNRVWLDEGGYSNHPSDPGGPTNWGITIHDYREYIDPDATADDVRAMKREESRQIYRKQYWDALRCDELPAGVDYSVFDYGVNSGVTRARRVLQQILGFPANDRTITNDVIAAAGRANPEALIKAIYSERLAFLKRLSTWSTFGVGWSRRVNGVRAASLAMARGEPLAKPKGLNGGKAQTKKPKSATPTAIGSAIGAIMAREAGSPWWANLLIIVAFALAGYLAYRWIKASRERQQITPVPGFELTPNSGVGRQP